MAKKRNNKRPSRGHLYSWAGVLEFMKNNPELVEAAGQAVSSQSNNNQGAITPVQTNVNTQQPAVQQNNKYSNPTPTFQGQQRQQDMGNVPIFSSLGQKVDKLNKNLIGIADNNNVLTEQKMNLPKDIWSRYYDFGGTMSAIEGGVDIVGDVAGDFRGLDLKKYKSQLNELASRNIEGASNDDLLDQYNDIHHLKHVGMHDITGGSYLTDVIGGLNRNAIAFGKGFSSTGSPWGGAAFAAVDLAGQIGGYFRRRNQIRHLNRQIDYTNARQDANFGNAVFNVDFDNDRALYRNFMKGYDGPYFSAAYGGPIHIADSKKGTFTAAATKHGMGVQEFASKVLANKDNYSPAMVKKANFAKNASHWHSTGGTIKPSYNNNPIISGYRYTNGDGILNYADGSSVIDSSDNKVLYDNRDDYMKYLANSYANGGSFSDFTNGVTIIGNGGTHEQNPFEGVQMGVAPDGKPNLVEEGEAIFNDYVFSNRLKVPKAVRAKYKLRGPKDMTFAEAFKVAQKESEERPNDPISKNGLQNIATILASAQEGLKQEEEEKQYTMSLGGNLFRKGGNTNNPKKNKPYSVEEKVGDLEGASLHYIIENLIDHPVTTARALRERNRRRKEKEFSGFGGGSFRGGGAGGTWTSGSVEEAIERSKEEAMKDKIIYSPGVPVETTTRKSFGEIYKEHELAGDTDFWLDGVHYLVQNDPNVKLGKKRYHNVTKSVPVVIREVEDGSGTVIPDSTASSIYTGQMLGKFDRAEDPNEVANRINGLPYYNGEVGFNGLKAFGGPVHKFAIGDSLFTLNDGDKKTRLLPRDYYNIASPDFNYQLRRNDPRLEEVIGPNSEEIAAAAQDIQNKAVENAITDQIISNEINRRNADDPRYEDPGYNPDAVTTYRSVNNPTASNTVSSGTQVNPGNGSDGNVDDSRRSRFSPLRYFSTLANAGAVLTDALGITNRPTVFDKIKGPALVRAPRLGNYLPVMNLDTRYESNVLAQQANATRNALMQSIAPSRAANILAADALAQAKMGELMRNAELANYDLAVKRAEFNRGTDQANAQMALTAAMENAKNKMANAEARLRQAKMNDEAQTLAWAAKAQNAKTLAENISNIGREQDAIDYRDMFIKMGPTLPDYMRPKGWSDKEWEDYKKKRQEIYDNSKNITACGGRIKRSKKRGLTY